MRFQMPHFPTEFEIPDEWLDEAGFQGFSPTSRFFLSSPEAILVPLTAIEPVARFVAHPKDWRGFDRKRLVSLLKGVMSGAMIQPVPVTEIPFIDLDPSPYRFRVHDGFQILRVGCSGLRSLADRSMNQRVPFGGRRPLDPRRANISIDGNVLNRGGGDESDRQIDRLLSLSAQRAINFVIAGGVRDEVLHPATPIEKKAVVIPQIYNLRPGRNSQQEGERRAVAAILQGNAKPETHAADASHLSEAAETGCAYFVTEDARILRKRAELAGVLPPSLQIVTLEEFLEVYDGYVGGKYL